MQEEGRCREFRWAERHSLLLVGGAPAIANVIGSAFNIWYNLTHVQPLLSDDQHARLAHTISAFNVVVYPAAAVIWLWIVLRLHRPLQRLLRREAIEEDGLWRARRRAINLPWWMTGICSVAWLVCIPVFVLSLMQLPDPLDPRAALCLSVSILVAASISITHGFFAIELISQQVLFPVLFGDTQPSSTPGAYPLTFRGRWIAWAVSAGVCPIISILMLLVAQDPAAPRDVLFPTAVALLAIAFGLTTAWMLGRLYSEPVRALKNAAQMVADGELETRVTLLRADEFGPLISEFNEMVAGLRKKRELRRTFGLHVGREAARQILARDPGLGGIEQQLTIMFVDIRNFTSSCQGRAPEKVVSLLNEFLTEMVDVVEQQHGGMVNKYLGDGFMALFGAGSGDAGHADAALNAGSEMLSRLPGLNDRFHSRGVAPMGIGIGIHTGLALVGSIGTERRLEFTAIGDAVNIASRVESLTKIVGVPLLITSATRDALVESRPLQECEPQQVKGVAEPLTTWTLPDDA